jgi:hypothetical protein
LLIGFCPRPVALVVFLLLIFSPVAQLLAERFDWPHAALASSIWREETQKRTTFTTVQQLLRYRERSDGHYVVVSGWYLPQLEVMTNGTPATAHVDYVYLLSKADMQRWRSRGARIIAGPGVSEYNETVYGIRLDAN